MYGLNSDRLYRYNEVGLAVVEHRAPGRPGSAGAVDPHSHPRTAWLSAGSGSTLGV